MGCEVYPVVCSVDWYAVLAGCAYITGALLQFTAIVGCVLPILPGPVLALAGLSLLYCTPTRPSLLVMALAAIVVIAAFALDYVVPSIGAKAFKCSKLGVAGCFFGSLFGTIIGFFVGFPFGAFPVLIGIVVYSFIGTFLGEAFSNKEFWPSVRGAFGSFIGFMVGILVKMALTAFIAVLFTWTVLWPLFKKALS